MGYTSYSSDSRSIRAASMDWIHKSVDETFTQNRERKAHETMLPKNAKMRECRDSDVHPNTVPIIVALDVTGSMGHIPHELVKEGLPTLMSTIITGGVPDANILFLAVGDHISDRYPLQVGQFESGDAELDMWLTRTYIEGNGGGWGRESYNLPWYYAANHTVTDSWEKRNKKGYLFTIGDEHCHETLSLRGLNEMFGDHSGQDLDLSSKSLLEKVREKYNVFHIHYNHGAMDEHIKKEWEALIGKQYLIEVKSNKDVAKTIADLIISFEKEEHPYVSIKESTNKEETKQEQEYL